ncbi:hypothetical protein G9A89_010803 [Geosiphon pyriformis]|nr:hypothetical protein G9A89_010803 [Geosiphon pyriformis]
MKQGETEAVTTYLGRFYRNLHQIQTIDTNYFTVPQIFNQFIHGLHSSILQYICPLHPDTLQNAVTCTRNFKSAESEANHAQAINLVMNRSSELDFKLKQFTIQKTTIVPKIKHVSQHWPISSGSQKRVFATTVVNKSTSEQIAMLIITKDTITTNSGSNQQQTLTNNIPPATVTNNKLLAAIFPFDLEETIEIPLFSGVALEEKPIITMYMDGKIDSHAIKLILNSRLAGSIITKQLMN